MDNNDILQELSLEDILKLIDLYKNHLPYATLAYNFLNTAQSWMQSKPNMSYVKIYSPHGNWDDGTFIGLIQCSCYDVFAFTLDKECKTLYKGLRETKKIDWKNKTVTFFGIHENINATVMTALIDSGLPIRYERLNVTFFIEKETALKYDTECPDGFSIEKLNKTHAPFISEAWLFKFDGCENYITFLIEENGGYGVFTKTGNKLVAWVLKNHIGIMGLLQTLEDYKQNGFASLIVRKLSKEIALKGFDPVATVLPFNTPSCNLFEKLGFKRFLHCNYFSSGKQDPVLDEIYYKSMVKK